MIFIYNSCVEQPKLRDLFIKEKFGIEILHAVFTCLHYEYDKIEQHSERKKLHEELKRRTEALGEDSKFDYEIEPLDIESINDTNEWFTRVLVLFINDPVFYFGSIFNNFMSGEERKFKFEEPSGQKESYKFIKQDLISLRELGIVFSVSLSNG